MRTALTAAPKQIPIMQRISAKTINRMCVNIICALHKSGIVMIPPLGYFKDKNKGKVTVVEEHAEVYTQMLVSCETDIKTIENRIQEMKNIDKNCMELKEFIEFCDWVDDIDVQFHVAALFAGRLGLRRSELAGLKYGDIDLKKKTLQLHSGRLPKGYTSKLKNKYSGQVIALPDTVIFFYNFNMQPKIHQSKDFVFWDKEKNEPKSVYWFSDMAKKYTKMFFKEKYNQDRYITIHGFRHTFAAYIVNSGYSIKAAQAMLRHGDINSTQIYLHPEAEATKKTTRELDDYITEKWEKEWMPEERRKALEE